MRLRPVAVVACLVAAVGIHCDSPKESPGGVDAAARVHVLTSGDGATVDGTADGASFRGARDGDSSSDDGSSSDGDSLGEEQENVTDAGNIDEWTLSTYEETCHIAWPQSAGYTIASADWGGFTVDVAGNSYVAIGFSSDNPPLDLGVPSLGYATGVAIAKVDPQCNLLWVYEYGTPSTAAMPVPSGLNLAVDATSSVTVTGTFSSPMNFGSGLIETQQSTGFVLRLDPDGNVVLQNDYPGSTVWILGVQADGTSTLMFDGDECPYLDAATCDAPAADGGATQLSVVRLDSTGAVITENGFPGSSAPSLMGPPTDFFSTGPEPFTVGPVMLDPAGTLVALTPGTGVPLFPVLQGLTLDGGVLWSRTAGWTYSALGPAGVVAYEGIDLGENRGPASQLQLIAYDGGVSWTELLGSPPETTQPNGSTANWLAVDPNGFIYIAGMTATSHYVPVLEVLDPQGAVKAWRAMGAAEYSNAMSVDANGNLIAIASIGSSSGPTNPPTYTLTKFAPSP